MNRKQQDLAWSVLPKEFKEEVKKYYAHYRCALNTYEAIINHFFGRHNLTSDAEGEEMLSIERILIQSYYNAHENSRDILYDLFGPKCLRDESASEVASETKSETDKHFDNILKDGFRNERRLNIAAMAMQGILSNPQLLKIAIETYQEEIGSPDIYVAVAKTAKAQADALIAECEEGGKS